jgi:osmotically-inducible protein OsmY
MSGQTTETNDLASQQAQQPAPVPQTTIVQQPAPVQQQPIVVQQPVPVPVIVTPPPSTATRGANDTEIEAAIQKKFSEDTALSALGVTVTVIDGEVTLLGTVKSEAEKTLAQRAVEAIRGVKNVDNQITVIP